MRADFERVGWALQDYRKVAEFLGRRLVAKSQKPVILRKKSPNYRKNMTIAVTWLKIGNCIIGILVSFSCTTSLVYNKFLNKRIKSGKPIKTGKIIKKSKIGHFRHTDRDMNLIFSAKFSTTSVTYVPKFLWKKIELSNFIGSRCHP